MSENETSKPLASAKPTAPAKPLSPEARRALEEAEQRRRTEADAAERPREIRGRGGKEPVRYGDWEVKGLASDF